MFYQLEHFGPVEHFRKDTSQNYSCPNHLHRSFELVVLLEGKMTVYIDNVPFELLPKQAVLIFPHQLHRVESQKSRHTVCIFSPETVGAYTSKTKGLLPADNRFVIGTELLNVFLKLHNNDTLIRKKGVLYSICDELDSVCKYVKKNTSDRNLLYRIFEFVEQNYNKNGCLEILSQSTAFSYSYLSRYFMKTVGMTFGSYVNRCRISHACDILRSSDTTVLQCSIECGYSSLRSFNRNFKSIMGCTPTEYRQKKEVN